MTALREYARTLDRRKLWQMARPLLLALAVSVILIFAVTRDFGETLETFQVMFDGSWGSPEKAAQTLMVWVPIVLAAAGLCLTFAAGMWNIGIEGQIVLGAIGASWVAREVGGPSLVVVPLTLIAGALLGMLWALLVGVLRTKGGVNEIFGGLGLDFVATSLTIYLIIGPWARTGVASTSGTNPFRTEAWLPRVGDILSPVAIAVALLGVLAVYVLLRGTLFGLRLKAVGRNRESSHLLGIPTSRYLLGSFAICGILAGLAGTVQATGFHHKLVPSVSGNYGFLGILVVLLAGFQVRWIAPIALFFASIGVGSSQLQLRLGLDSSLGGVVQGVLVLFAIFSLGWQMRTRRRREEAAT